MADITIPKTVALEWLKAAYPNMTTAQLEAMLPRPVKKTKPKS